MDLGKEWPSFLSYEHLHMGVYLAFRSTKVGGWPNFHWSQEYLLSLHIFSLVTLRYNAVSSCQILGNVGCEG